MGDDDLFLAGLYSGRDRGASPARAASGGFPGFPDSDVPPVTRLADTGPDSVPRVLGIPTTARMTDRRVVVEPSFDDAVDDDPEMARLAAGWQRQPAGGYETPAPAPSPPPLPLQPLRPRRRSSSRGRSPYAHLYTPEDPYAASRARQAARDAAAFASSGAGVALDRLPHGSVSTVSAALRAALAADHATMQATAIERREARRRAAAERTAAIQRAAKEPSAGAAGTFVHELTQGRARIDAATKFQRAVQEVYRAYAASLGCLAASSCDAQRAAAYATSSSGNALTSEALERELRGLRRRDTQCAWACVRAWTRFFDGVRAEGEGLQDAFAGNAALRDATALTGALLRRFVALANIADAAASENVCAATAMRTQQRDADECAWDTAQRVLRIVCTCSKQLPRDIDLIVASVQRAVDAVLSAVNVSSVAAAVRDLETRVAACGSKHAAASATLRLRETSVAAATQQVANAETALTSATNALVRTTTTASSGAEAQTQRALNDVARARDALQDASAQLQSSAEALSAIEAQRAELEQQLAVLRTAARVPAMTAWQPRVHAALTRCHRLLEAAEAAQGRVRAALVTRQQDEQEQCPRHEVALSQLRSAVTDDFVQACAQVISEYSVRVQTLPAAAAAAAPRATDELGVAAASAAFADALDEYTWTKLCAAVSKLAAQWPGSETQPEQDKREREQDREREKDREQEREKDREQEREKEREREREKDRKKEREREREKEREREREKEREREREQEREREREKEREQEREREREKEREQEREREKEREKEREREREKEREKEREREQERKRERERKEREEREDRERQAREEREEQERKAREEREAREAEESRRKEEREREREREAKDRRRQEDRTLKAEQAATDEAEDGEHVDASPHTEELAQDADHAQPADFAEPANFADHVDHADLAQPVAELGGAAQEEFEVAKTPVRPPANGSVFNVGGKGHAKPKAKPRTKSAPPKPISTALPKPAAVIPRPLPKPVLKTGTAGTAGSAASTPTKRLLPSTAAAAAKPALKPQRRRVRFRPKELGPTPSAH
jgi:hypothetical protein